MINASKEKLLAYFQGNNQFVVPFFQRPYVWTEDNWQILWDHALSVLERSERGESAEHFIGTIITKQQPAQMLGQSICDLIDGQQRLATVAIFLRALGDSSDETMPNLRGSVDAHLSFRDARNKAFFRIVPSKNDQRYFEAVMTGKNLEQLKNVDHKLLAAYRFFRAQLNGFSDERLDTLRLILLERVPVISMLLSAEDDEQEIFDTINALGVRLTTSELLKNFIFKEDELKDKFGPLWEEVFESTESQVDFWGREKTAGRVFRTNIEVLLYCYLVIKTGGEVRLENLFKEYKKWLSGNSPAEKIEFLKELRRYADIYFNLPSGELLNQISFDEGEKRFFHVVDNLMVTTIYPLVLYLYCSENDATERLKMLRLLECYLVRRNVCRYTAKNYNLLFIQIIGKLALHLRSEAKSLRATDLAEILLTFKEETNLMPSDSEFGQAFHSSALSNQNSREILYLIALKQAATGMADMPRLSLGNYSTEHIMPVKWEENWTSRKMSEVEKLERSKTIKTLGNLTLVTKRLNSRMQNSAWADKRDVLRPNSALPMTTNYLSKPKWDERTIKERADALAVTAMEIWSTEGFVMSQ